MQRIKMNEISLLPLPGNVIPPKLMHGETVRGQVRVMIEKEENHFYSPLGRGSVNKNKKHRQQEERRGRRRGQESSPGKSTRTGTGGSTCSNPRALTNKEPLKIIAAAAGVKEDSFVVLARKGWRPDPSSSSTTCSKQEQQKEHEGVCSPSLVSEDEVDAIYRLKMSEWSYRIIDYFGANREIVAISFDYLDRFIDSGIFSCDTAFAYKLASITALCIALKVHNRQTIKTSMLAKLSKGELTVQDINAMENLMLNALSYHLCPPTCRAFIGAFYTFMPAAMQERVGMYLMQQAVFMSELSVMEVCFKDVLASHIAFGAMLNVMDSLDATILSPFERDIFVKSVVENCVLLPSASSTPDEKYFEAYGSWRESCFWSGVNRARYQFGIVLGRVSHFVENGMDVDSNITSTSSIENEVSALKYNPCCDEERDEQEGSTSSTAAVTGVGHNGNDDEPDECKDNGMSKIYVSPGTVNSAVGDNHCDDNDKPECRDDEMSIIYVSRVALGAVDERE